MARPISNVEKDLLLELLQAYRDKMRAESAALNTLIAQGILSGNLSHAGKLYTANKNIFIIQDKAAAFIVERIDNANHLINRLINSTKNFL